MNKNFTKALVFSVITFFALGTAQARTFECSTQTEVGENFDTNTNLYERDVSNSSKGRSIFDLSSLSITNADTNNKTIIKKVAENLYENRSDQFLWQYMINRERTIVIETSMTGNLVYVKILKCKRS